MPESKWNRHHLAWTKLCRSILELNVETPLDHKECLIGVRMEVPRVGCVITLIRTT
jgi:hypothetical protein